MLTELTYLWQHRERPNKILRNTKVWGKRFRHLPNLLSLFFSRSILVSRGASVGPFSIFTRSRVIGRASNLTVGRESSIGRCELHLHAPITIGNRVVINDGSIFLTASHSLSDEHWPLRSAAILVDDYAWIAVNAIILPGVRIGKGAVIGAGAVVRDHVPDYAVATGNPATFRLNAREPRLNYSPIFMIAPLEAWVGPVHSKIDR